MELDRTSRRVLGSLVEKRMTTPDLYPLTLNALVAACNQKSNRHPVLELESFEVEGCLLGLRQAGLLAVHEREGGRTTRYSERLGEKLGLDRSEEAILAELILRGPQTVPELYRRCQRMTDLPGPEAVESALGEMAVHRLVALLPRHTGQRHARWRHLLTPAGEAETLPEGEEAESAAATGSAPPDPRGSDEIQGELEELRADVSALRAEVHALREQLERLSGGGGG